MDFILWANLPMELKWERAHVGPPMISLPPPFLLLLSLSTNDLDLALDPIWYSSRLNPPSDFTFKILTPLASWYLELDIPYISSSIKLNFGRPLFMHYACTSQGSCPLSFRTSIPYINNIHMHMVIFVFKTLESTVVKKKKKESGFCRTWIIYLSKFLNIVVEKPSKWLFMCRLSNVTRINTKQTRIKYSLLCAYSMASAAWPHKLQQ